MINDKNILTFNLNYAILKLKVKEGSNMGKNDFRVDTAEQKSRKMLAKNQTLLGLALLLTVPQMFCAVFLPVRWVMDIRNGVSHNVAALASNELYFLVMAIAGAAVLKMMLSDKTFSKTLVWCVRLEGILLAIAAAIFPHLPGYVQSGSTFLIFDAVYLLPGVLLIIMSELLKEAFEMQKELNEIL